MLAFLMVCGLANAQTAPTTSSDDALMNELAARGLTSLLDRAFEINHVPPEQREARRALLALSQLGESAKGLSAQQRQQLVTQSVTGIQKVLPTLTDPQTLMRQAFVLITQGIDPEVNTLEYWGENPHTQARLRPIAQAVSDMLGRATEIAKSQADEIANKITSPSSPFAEQYDQIAKLAATAEYTRNMVAYDLTLALDPSSPQRKKAVADAIDYLAQFNVADNPDRGAVRNRLAKLAMTQRDYDGAKKLFAATVDDAVKPGPTVPQQYEAKYFIAVCDVLDRQLSAAQGDLKNLGDWQDANLPKDKASREGAEAATSLLQYRIASLQADLAKDPAAVKSANDSAVAILLDLLGKRPELRPIIYEQLLPKLGPDVNLKTLDPLLLRALVSRGEQVLQAPADQPVDAKALAKGVDAAHELLGRGASASIDPQTVDATMLLIGFFQQKLGQRGPAANSFIDYVDRYKSSNSKDATLALDNAQALIGQARADAGSRDDPQITRAYERFLPAAVGEPFNRKQFAFEYARRLQLNNKPGDALTYFAQMPADDKRQPEARFDQLVALKQQLDALPPNDPRRVETLKRIQQLVDQTLSTANSGNDKLMLARTALLAADLARREQHDPARALKLVDTVDAAAAGLPDQGQLLNEALYIRVQALMNQQQYTQATQQLVTLLGKTGGAQGAQIVYNLLQKLNEDFDRAESANDRAAMKSLADSRAQLSQFLVQWAAGNSDPNIKKFTYRYKVFDADTQRRAAELQETPEKRLAAMKQALPRFAELQSPENVALYRASVDSKSAAEDDPQVTFGLAQCEFALGDFKSAADHFSQLINGRKLGTAILVVDDNGTPKQIDNDRYWEAVLKLIRADQQLGLGVDAAKDFLKLQYITWGEHVGGVKWKPQYEQLRAELIPGFDATATTAPATTPAE